MTDLAPEFDFTAASREAEQRALEEAGLVEAEEAPAEDAPAEEQPEEVVVEAEAEPEGEGSDERPRGPDGRFLPKDAEPEPDDFYVGRYKTREEAERGYAEAQAAAQRAQAERDQARQQVEQYEAWLREQQAQAQRQSQQPTDWAQAIDENPARAAQLAHQLGNEAALRAAAEAWEELSPGAPAIWWQNQQLQARLEQLERGVNERIAPVAESHLVAQREQALLQFVRENPDLDAYNDKLVDVASRHPELLATIETGTPEGQASAIKLLYKIAKVEEMESAQAIGKTIAREQAEEGQRVREEAFVASSQTATAQVPVTYEEQEKMNAEEQFARRSVKWEEGWERPEATRT